MSEGFLGTSTPIKKSWKIKHFGNALESYIKKLVLDDDVTKKASINTEYAFEDMEGDHIIPWSKGGRAYTYVLLKGKTKMKNESVLYSYYNDEMQKSTTEDDAVYDKGAISESKLKQAITSCANYLFLKRENKEKLVLEISCLKENENYQSRSNKIYKADKCIRKMVSYYFSAAAIIMSVVQKILTSYTEMEYIYVLIIITLISAFFNWLKNYFENIPDMKLSKADAFYDSILKNTFKKVIKKMLVEQNSIKTMEKQEFESWFTSQVYALLDI